MEGYILLYRKIEQHWIFKKPENLHAWITILLTVNFQDSKVNINNRLYYCSRGESLLSLDSWARKFGLTWNKSKVRRFFKLLESDSMIITKSERVTTRLIVRNYDSYQIPRNTNETHLKQECNTNDTNRIKEKKVNKYNSEFEFFFAEYHKITGKPKSDKHPTYEHFQRLTIKEKEKALKNIGAYYNSVVDKKYIKKARTYISDKSFDDDFKPVIKLNKAANW